MTEVRDRLRQARIAAGFPSASAAARALGVPVPSYSHHENGTRNIDQASAKAYAIAFGVRMSWLLLGEEPMTLGVSADPARHPANASPPVPVRYPTERLPMLGRAAAGNDADGRIILNGGRVGDALIPPQLIGVPDAYGVFVHGDSMEPRYHPGEAVFVNPHLPVRRDDYVVVQVAGDFEGDDLSGYIKRFWSMSADEVILRQYKRREDVANDEPEDEHFTLRFPREKVIAVHKIVAAGIV